MDLEISSTLESTRNMLGSSLGLRTDDPAPPIPAELHRDLHAKFSPLPAGLAAKRPGLSWFARLSAALSTPGFAVSAAAIVLLAVLSPIFLKQPVENFRGASATAYHSVPVLLVNAPASLHADLIALGDLESGSIQTLGSLEEASKLEGVKVIVDPTAGTIKAVDAEDTVVFEKAIPSDGAGISILVAEAVSHL